MEDAHFREDEICFRLYDCDSVDENACRPKADLSIHSTDHISETGIKEKSADEQQNGMTEFFRTLLQICCEENCSLEKLTEALLSDSVVLEKEELLLGLMQFIESAVNGSLFLQGSDNSPQSWKHFFHCLKVLITSLKEYPERKTGSRLSSYLAPQGTQQPITESTRDSFIPHSFGNSQEVIISHGENESFEGIGGETSISDVTELAAEVEELQHQNKKLLEENQRFRTQVSATEEMCQQLSFENEELSQKIKNFQAEVERLKDFEVKNEELKVTLLSVEKSKKILMAKFSDYEDHEQELKNEMRDLQKQLASSRCEADHKKQLLADILSSLCEQKQQNDELYREKIELRSELCEKSVKCEDLEAAVRELSEANKSLRSDNNFKDSELMKAKEEMSCVLEKMKHFVTLTGSGDSPHVRMACIQERAPSCHASEAVYAAHASSSEFSLLSEQSIHSEMYSMISSSEGLSTPFCGKDSLRVPFSRRDVLLSSLKKQGRKINEKNVRHTHKSYSRKKNLVSSRKKVSVKRRKKYHSSNSAVSTQSESSLCDGNVEKETLATDFSDEDSPGQCLMEQKEVCHKKSEQTSEMILKNVFLIHIRDQMELLRRYTERANLKTEDSLKLKFDDMQVEQTLPSPQIPAIVDVAAKDIHTQIGTEIQALKAQLIRSHALLSYLQSKGTLPYREAYFDSFIQAEKFTESQQRVKGHLLQQRSLDEQTAFPCHLHSKKNSSVTASNKSTPLHHSYFAQSCPVLLGGLPVTSKAIQADLLHETSSERPAQNCVQESTVALHRLEEGYEHLASEERRPVKLPSVPETTSKSAENLECYVCEAYTDENGPFPRLRTNSFLTAVKSGSSESFESYVGLQNGSQDKTVQSSASALSPKDSVRLEQLGGSDAKRNLVLPQNLPVVLEEDSKMISTPDCQPLIRLRKNGVTSGIQTESETASSNVQSFLQKKIENSESCMKSSVHNGLPCHPHKLCIITEMVEKKTAYSEKIDCDVLYPPAQTIQYRKHCPCASSLDIPYQLGSKNVGSSILKKSVWSRATSSKCECVPTDKSGHQARPLSWRMQENTETSSSSCRFCQHEICQSCVPPSNSSGQAATEQFHYEAVVQAETKRMEANENVQLQGSQKPYQTSSLVQKENESCLSSSTTNSGTIHATSLKEKSYKVPQRSFRRGSGAGSPNSLSCIPRYPAFDFSEQDEDNSTTTSATKQVVTFEKNIEQSSKLNEGTKSGSHVTVNVPVCKEMAVQKSEPGKSTMLMPEPVENSETESAKGSFEYEAPEAHVAPEAPPLPVPETAFPNLPDTLLLKLGIKKDGSVATEMLGDQELESKFMTLALAFKTDKMTLPKRLEIQKRQRDIAEQDVENEIRAVRESLNYLNTHATSSEMRDLITKLQNHIDIVRLATSKVSARSETYGAVKQEERVSCAFEVMMLHVENLKRLFDKEHRELEETKQLLSGTQAFKKEAGREGTVEEHRRSLKTFGMAIGSIKSVVRRRASVAEFCHFSTQSVVKTPITSSSLFTPNGVDSKSRLFSALSPFTSSHSLDVNRSSLSSPSYNPCSWSPNQVSGSRRCSLPTTNLTGSAVPSQSLGPKRMETLQLKKNSSDLKISMVPSLSPVVDEELYENETAETEGSENGLNADGDSVQNGSLHHEQAQENQSFGVSSSEEQTSDTADCTIKEDIRDVQDPPPQSDVLKSNSLVERLGYMTAVQDIWTTSSFLTLFRYAVSFLFGLTAVVMLLFSCVPSKLVQK